MPRSRTALLLLLAALPVPAGFQGNGRRNREASQNSTGNTALIDLGTSTYEGFEGGLYPGGVNTLPEEHLRNALEQARLIQPLGPSGEPDPERGLIALLAIGMSNAAHEFAQFERQEDANPLRNPRLVLVNGAEAGQSSDALADPEAEHWQRIHHRLSALELTPAQVQVVWLRENRAPAYQRAIKGAKKKLEEASKDFPRSAELLRDELELIARILKSHFPNLRLCYLSDGTYRGHEGLEPAAYETGFGIKWVIEAQIAGQATLSWKAEQGGAQAPLLLWGPYLWADGEVPNGLGTQWLRGDFEDQAADHPSRSGEQKVADLLSDFFAEDPTAVPWFSNASGTGHVALDAVADTHVDASRPQQNFGSSLTLLTADLEGTAVSYLRFDLSGVRRPVLHAKLSLRNPEEKDQGDQRIAFLVFDDDWDESTLTFETAPELSVPLGTIPPASRDGTRSLGVTAAVNQQSDSILTLAVAAPEGGHPSQFVSREGGSAPRLVIIERPRDESAHTPHAPGD